MQRPKQLCQAHVNQNRMDLVDWTAAGDLLLKHDMLKLQVLVHDTLAVAIRQGPHQLYKYSPDPSLRQWPASVCMLLDNVVQLTTCAQISDNVNVHGVTVVLKKPKHVWVVQHSKEINLLVQQCKRRAALLCPLLINGLERALHLGLAVDDLVDHSKLAGAEHLAYPVELARHASFHPANEVFTLGPWWIQILVLPPQRPAVELQELICVQHTVAVAVKLPHAHTHKAGAVLGQLQPPQAQLSMELQDEPLQLTKGQDPIAVHVVAVEDGHPIVL
mmetsp:Transcript_55439/g.161903  ORF Transcript_55439/g.161903 Transcript_55439/m.161903 type:complete len:275 (-) Transcript_55439:668-1492(-)